MIFSFFCPFRMFNRILIVFFLITGNLFLGMTFLPVPVQAQRVVLKDDISEPRKKETSSSQKSGNKKPKKTSSKSEPKPEAKLSWGTYVQTPSFKRSSSRKTKKSSKKEEKTSSTVKERNLERMAHLRKTGILLWPEYSERELNIIQAQQMDYLEKIRASFKKLGDSLRYYETDHFYFVTDATEGIARDCCLYLEAMYAKLGDIFGIPADAQFWRGKCTVIAFNERNDFLEFEKRFFDHTVRGSTAGLAHTGRSGDVVISLYFRDITTVENRWAFIGVLVHETTHGFMHRYKSSEKLPLWLEEGIADYMAGTIVVKDKQVSLKQKSALDVMKKTRSLGGIMSAQRNLEVWQYGVASGMVTYLLRVKSGGVGKIVDLIKDGKEWPEALKEVYDWTPEEFIQNFGKTYKIQGLQP
ncbi:MAG: hypothetical protein Q4C96_00125 [Planctomycetia bacterium]|nr:hypothetical protein [Planctomycetia bacterium]